MNITIRNAVSEDMHGVHALVRELAEYERAPEEVITSPEEFIQDGFGERNAFQCLVAEGPAGNIIGAALYYPTYSTWKGRVIYLEDLVVTQRFRQLGIGKMLFDALVKRAEEEGVRQIRWQVLDWNEPAIKFYQKIQADLDPEWINCRLNVGNSL